MAHSNCSISHECCIEISYVSCALRNSANCYTQKNQAKAAGKPPAKSTFTNKELCKEINLMAKHSSKEKVLDLYASVISKAQAKLKKAKTKKEKNRGDGF